MILIEGADNTGKSTLVKKLLTRCSGIMPLVRERFKPGMEGTIGQTHIQALLPITTRTVQQHYNTISDRTFFSECIYGQLFRGGCRMTAAEHFQLYALLHRYRAIVIWCDTPDVVIEATWRKREQLYDRDPLVIARAYREHIPRLTEELTCFCYDWTRAGNDALLDRIVRLHQHMIEHSPRIQSCV
jgi:thymidylate kinase